MKSFIAVLIILFVIIALVVANSLYVTNIFSRLSTLSESIIESKSEGAEAEKILSLWQDSRHLLSFSIEADELERMNDLIESLHTASATKNLPEVFKCCRLISELSDELMSYECISLQSIF
ncbi:MAG: DUF4363 family protein [Clostridia bacterium]|nr:DUF4363 family protein [Clostridia bacterium]